MRSFSASIPTLEQRYNGPPPPHALRYALYGGAAYVARRANSEILFLSREVLKTVFAIAQKRARTQAPKINHRLATLSLDLAALRERAIAGTDWRRPRRAL